MKMVHLTFILWFLAFVHGTKIGDVAIQMAESNNPVENQNTLEVPMLQNNHEGNQEDEQGDNQEDEQGDNQENEQGDNQENEQGDNQEDEQEDNQEENQEGNEEDNQQNNEVEQNDENSCWICQAAFSSEEPKFGILLHKCENEQFRLDHLEHCAIWHEKCITKELQKNWFTPAYKCPRCQGIMSYRETNQRELTQMFPNLNDADNRTMGKLRQLEKLVDNPCPKASTCVQSFFAVPLIMASIGAVICHIMIYVKAPDLNPPKVFTIIFLVNTFSLNEQLGGCGYLASIPLYFLNRFFLEEQKAALDEHDGYGLYKLWELENYVENLYFIFASLVPLVVRGSRSQEDKKKPNWPDYFCLTKALTRGCAMFNQIVPIFAPSNVLNMRSNFQEILSLGTLLTWDRESILLLTIVNCFVLKENTNSFELENASLMPFVVMFIKILITLAFKYGLKWNIPLLKF